MEKILHKLTYVQNPSQYEAHPSYYEEILCKVLTVQSLPKELRPTVPTTARPYARNVKPLLPLSCRVLRGDCIRITPRVLSDISQSCSTTLQTASYLGLVVGLRRGR